MNQSVFGYFLTNFSYFYFNIRLTTMNWNLWHNVGQTLVTEILSSMIDVEEQVNHLLEIQKKNLEFTWFCRDLQPCGSKFRLHEQHKSENKQSESHQRFDSFVVQRSGAVQQFLAVRHSKSVKTWWCPKKCEVVKVSVFQGAWIRRRSLHSTGLGGHFGNWMCHQLLH